MTRFVSTRGRAPELDFADVVLEGLARDGGLYVPERYPRSDAATLARWRALSYQELAFAVMSLFVDDVDSADLKALLARTYRADVFGDARIQERLNRDARAERAAAAAETAL